MNRELLSSCGPFTVSLFILMIQLIIQTNNLFNDIKDKKLLFRKTMFLLMNLLINIIICMLLLWLCSMNHKGIAWIIVGLLFSAIIGLSIYYLIYYSKHGKKKLDSTVVNETNPTVSDTNPTVSDTNPTVSDSNTK